MAGDTPACKESKKDTYTKEQKMLPVIVHASWPQVRRGVGSGREEQESEEGLENKMEGNDEKDQSKKTGDSAKKTKKLEERDWRQGEEKRREVNLTGGKREEKGERENDRRCCEKDAKESKRDRRQQEEERRNATAIGDGLIS